MTDESPSRDAMRGTDRTRLPAGDSGRRLVELDRGEALHRLGSVAVGRIVFTQHALPAIRPVNHLVHHGAVIIRTHVGAAIVSVATNRAVVAYEADTIDSDTHLGWSVIVTGTATLVTDPDQADRYRRLLRPWIDQPTKDYVLSITPELVTGFELIPAAP